MITPNPSVSWEATGGLNSGGEGSDQQIAVSSSHVGVSGRAVLAFYTKTGHQGLRRDRRGGLLYCAGPAQCQERIWHLRSANDL